MGGVSQNPPSAGGFPATIDNLTGVVTWNTTGAVLGGLYSCQVIIEDRDAIDPTILRTRVAVDFLIQISPQCTNPNFPIFDAPTPTCGTVFNEVPGTPISFSVNASDIDPGNITLNAIGLPPGSTMNPVLPQVGNPVSSTFDWIAQPGVYIVSFIATDSCGAQTIYTIHLISLFLLNCHHSLPQLSEMMYHFSGQHLQKPTTPDLTLKELPTSTENFQTGDNRKRSGNGNSSSVNSYFF
ncbi:MAG: hypothetical protein IPM38_19160 [Ignavibacteria bacterium]|nr:hypothetical protein [Ignavibacteria bacterium]